MISCTTVVAEANGSRFKLAFSFKLKKSLFFILGCGSEMVSSSDASLIKLFSCASTFSMHEKFKLWELKRYTKNTIIFLRAFLLVLLKIL